ncbi:Pentatricopeptide repeat [Macleaya cordata]|uniref:Pentatricopeptide repeat n=1 Tax=Macleaya cordata TaxID=56857 RepID=A0A200QXA4_MACCD|nr:Pentatricopeptide repeat [Macleaya cordata]
MYRRSLRSIQCSSLFSTTTTVRSFSYCLAVQIAAAAPPAPPPPPPPRRRRKYFLLIERSHLPEPDPNSPRLPESTSALVGKRLNLHNKVQTLIHSGNLDSASATAGNAVSSDTRPTVFTCNAVMVSMYSVCRYNDVVHLFHFFFNESNIIPNVISYNTLIKAHCDAGRVDVALDVYRHILAEAPFSPSPVTYGNLTKGLVDSNRISEAVDLLREMTSKGDAAESDSVVYNNLISGFLQLGKLDKALELFEELRERCSSVNSNYDGVVHATFMDWYFTNGREKDAMESYQTLIDRQFAMKPATCNALLKVLLRYGKSLEASTLFDNMLNSHTPPRFHAVNSDTYNIMVNECFKLGKISEAMAVFRKTGTKQGSKPYAMDAACFNNIMGKLCEHGLVSDAEKLLQEIMQTKPVIQDFTTYKIFIEVYLKEDDRVDDAIQLFNEMLFKTSLIPGKGFCDKVFYELLKKGRLEEASDILGRMGGREVKPDPTSYEIVITQLSEAGRLDNARDLLDQMKKYGIALTPTLRRQYSRKS